MSKKPLTASMIALINVAAVCNIKNFPLLAEYGLSVIPFLFLSALFFFVPVSLVAAELASAWPDQGIYTWIKEAMGPQWGFIAIWLQWIENVIWYPTILSFVAATLAYTFHPELANNNLYVMSCVLIAFWSVTLLSFLGMRVSGIVSSLTAILGTILPIGLIILLSAIWIFSGRPIAISFSWQALAPDLTTLNQLVLLSGILMGLAGMEMSAVHARDVRNPKKDYPRAIFLSTLLILSFSILGSIAISAIIPAERIELASGGMEAFRILFNAYGIDWATTLIALVATIGALGMMSTWIVGPSRGLLASAEQGALPPIFHKTNKRSMPVSILLIQGMIVTLLSLIFLIFPSVNSSYWALVALASILYQIMYILLFCSAFILRYKHPYVERPFRIPGGAIGMAIVATLGTIGSLFGLILSLFPPSQFNTGKLIIFESFIAGSALLFCALPVLIYRLRKSPR